MRVYDDISIIETKWKPPLKTHGGSAMLAKGLVVVGAALTLSLPELSRRPSETVTASLEPHQAIDGHAAFERLRGLVGTWSFSVDGRPMPDEATFRIAGGGRVLVEDMGGMVTMYHLDGDQLLLTHYCNAGNQPRMRMTKGDDDNIAFEMYDITNLASPTSYHSTTLNVKFVGPDHAVLTYGGKSGRKEPPQVFALKRKK